MEIIKIFFIIMLFFLLSWSNFFIFSVLSGVYYYYKNKKQELLSNNQNVNLFNVLILCFILITEAIFINLRILYFKISKNIIVRTITQQLNRINNYYLTLKVNVFVYLTSLFFKLLMGNDKPVESNIRPVSVLRDQKDIDDFLNKLK